MGEGERTIFQQVAEIKSQEARKALVDVIMAQSESIIVDTKMNGGTYKISDGFRAWLGSDGRVTLNLNVMGGASGFDAGKVNVIPPIADLNEIVDKISPELQQLIPVG